MPNKNYIKGVRKERKIVNAARELGHISFRSAGSHSPIDVVIINPELREINLLQCKPEDFAGLEKLEAQWGYLTGTYKVKFRVV